MTSKRETIGITKEPERLWYGWPNMSRRVRELSLPNLRMASRVEKDFKSQVELMSQTKKNAVWEWAFDFASFEFEFCLLVGSNKTILGSAQMNVIALPDRPAILDSLRTRSTLVTQAEIDQYLKKAEQAAAGRGEIRKIDEEIHKLERDIEDRYQYMKAIMPKKLDDMDFTEIRTSLEPFAKTLGKEALVNVRFLYGVDAGWAVNVLMSAYLAQGAKEPLPGIPSVVLEKLRTEWNGGKGKADLKPLRKYVGAWVDKHVMPGWIRQQVKLCDASIAEDKRKNAANLVLRTKMLRH
ncbi:MAG: hypothetical protein ABI460_10825 [Caldimonas sp.]